MNILKNKYFILGNILLLLAIIPLTLFVVKRQTNLRSKAAPNTVFSLAPVSATTAVGQTTLIDVTVDPGQNVVSIVELNISVDPDKLEIEKFEPNSTAFPLKLKGPTINDTKSGVTASLSTSSEVQKAIQTPTKIGTLTIKGKAPTDATPALIKFNKSTSQAFSLATSDGATENVLSDTGTAAITVTGDGLVATPSPVLIGEPAPTASPSADTNTKPVCTNFSIDKDASGVAPYSLVFTTTGSSPVDTIAKIAFDFGDGEKEEASASGGIGTNAVNLPIAHTYNNPGVYLATSILTDSQGNVSDTTICSKTITINALAVNPSPTDVGPSPTLPITGTLETTLAILGIVGTVIGVGLFLFVL